MDETDETDEMDGSGWIRYVCIGNFSYVHCTVSSGVLDFFLMGTDD
jgi:hypothetical protein